MNLSQKNVNSFLIINIVILSFLIILMRDEQIKKSKMINSLKTKIEVLKEKVDSLTITQDTLIYDNIIATAYNSKRNQTDNTPFIAANGERVDDYTLALSRDMIKAENNLMIRMGYNPKGRYSFGDTVTVVYTKKMVIKDTMHRRKKRQADIWTKDYTTAMQWGIRKIKIIKRLL